MILKSIFLSLIFSINTPQKKDFISKKHFLDNNIFSVLILSETQGYVHHTAIKEGVKLITKLGKKNNFNVTHTNSSEFLSDEILKKNDVLIAITTSGNSANVINVLKDARSKKITTLGFLGGSGGKCKKLCDIGLIVPSKSTARIQECHIFLGHFIFEQVENLILKK